MIKPEVLQFLANATNHQSTDKRRLERILVWRSGWALGLLVFLVGTGHWMTLRGVQAQRTDAHEINVAGRQRMLSQRLSYRAEQIVRSSGQARERAVEALARDIDVLQEKERALREGDERIGISGEYSEATRARMLETQAAMENLVDALRAVSELPPGEPPVRIPGHALDALQSVESNRQVFLAAMEETVKSLDVSAQARVARVRRLLLIWNGLIGLALALQFFLIFRPAVKGLGRRGHDLTRASAELQQTNRVLQETLDKLIRGILPMCAECKAIRREDGVWVDISEFLVARTDANVSHGLCEKCVTKLYPDEAKELLAAGGTASQQDDAPGGQDTTLI